MVKNIPMMAKPASAFARSAAFDVSSDATIPPKTRNMNATSKTRRQSTSNIGNGIESLHLRLVHYHIQTLRDGVDRGCDSAVSFKQIGLQCGDGRVCSWP